jgi:chorismate dehydratase
MAHKAVTDSRDRRQLLRVGCVSYLNSKPLIYGLDRSPGLSLILRVPAALLAGLRDQSFDVALLPVIDYQRLAGLKIVPAGGIGSAGPTLTVRIFSRRPIEQITTLACDIDSHTSVALARVLLAERFGLHPEFVEPSRNRDAAEAMLLIGDKVVCDAPADMPHQLDLGAAWKELTGLPFVFAVWTARADVDLGDLPTRLADARRHGMEHLDEIVNQYAVPLGWPAQLAMEYLSRYLDFEIGPRQLQAIEQFYALAARHGLIPNPPRPIELYKP